MPPLRIAIDADVLVAAFCSPSGPSARLLQLVPLGIFQPVITPEVLAEAEALGRAGVGGRVPTDGEWLAFRASVAELLTQDPAPAGASIVGIATRLGCGGICAGTPLTSSLPCMSPAELLDTLLATE